MLARAGRGDRCDAGGAGELGVGGEALGAGDLADQLGGGQRADSRARRAAAARAGRPARRSRARARRSWRELRARTGALGRARSGPASSARRAPGDGRSCRATSLESSAPRRDLAARARGRADASAAAAESSVRDATRSLAMVDSSRMSSAAPVQLRRRQRARGPPAARRGRPRARRSGRTCRARGRRAARPAISRGATRTTRSPRAIRNRSNAPDTCRQSSIAHTRSPPSRRAQASSRRQPAAADRDRLAAQPLAGRRIDRATVCDACVCPPRARSCAPSLPRSIRERTSGGHGSLGAMPRSYQVTPVILERRRATQRMKVRPRSTASLRVSPPPPEDQHRRSDVTAQHHRLSH